MDTLRSTYLIHINVLLLVSVHQKSVHLFFLLTHSKYCLFYCLFVVCYGCYGKQLYFFFALYFFSFSLIVSVNMSRLLAFFSILESFYFMYALLIHQQKGLIQSILNWNSILDQHFFPHF